MVRAALCRPLRGGVKEALRMRVPVVQHSSRRRSARRRRALWSGGELLVTVGVVLLLLVVHQLWWTNREAKRGAERKVEALDSCQQLAMAQRGSGGGPMTSQLVQFPPSRPTGWSDRDGHGGKSRRTGLGGRSRR